MTGDHVTSGHHMREQGQPRPPGDNRPDTDMCADGPVVHTARDSVEHRRRTQPVPDPVPVANLTDYKPCDRNPDFAAERGCMMCELHSPHWTELRK